MIEQAPQLPVSHPMCVPFMASVSLMKCTSNCRDSTVAVTFSPLSVNSIACTVPASATVCSSRCLYDRTLGGHARHRAPVLGAAVGVADRLEVGPDRLGGGANRLGLRLGAAERVLHPPVAGGDRRDAGQHDPGLRDRAVGFD